MALRPVLITAVLANRRESGFVRQEAWTRELVRIESTARAITPVSLPEEPPRRRTPEIWRHTLVHGPA